MYRVAVWCSVGKNTKGRKPTDVDTLVGKEIPENVEFTYIDTLVPNTGDRTHKNINVLDEKQSIQSLGSHSIDPHSFDAVLLENCPLNNPVGFLNLHTSDIIIHNLSLMLKDNGKVYIRVMFDATKDINLMTHQHSKGKPSYFPFIKSPFIPYVNISAKINETPDVLKDVSFIYETATEGGYYSIFRFEIDKYTNTSAIQIAGRGGRSFGSKKPRGLETLTVKDLQERCKKRKIPYSGLTKRELVAALRKIYT